MDTAGFIHHLTAQTGYADQISHIEKIPPREAVYSDLRLPISPALQKALDDNALWPLYSHQAEAVDLALQAKTSW
jgi:DEAD/DEAH box helicase domain-containing protein